MTVLIDPRDAVQIEFVLKRLRENEPVALPTETVYGLAARALSEEALARIFELKARPTFDPLIVHVLELSQLEEMGLVHSLTPLHRKLAEKFWPGPLTLLFEKTDRIPDLCTASTPWVAVRSPEHPVFRMILEHLGDVLAAPSANRFQSISPTHALAVVEELGPYGLSAVVEGGASSRGIESTVVKILGENSVEVIRQGAVSVEELRSFLGDACSISLRASGSGAQSSHESPGQSEVHYAPRKPLYLVDASEVQEFLDRCEWNRVALLEVFPASPSAQITHSKISERLCLSEASSWPEAAARLFASMRQLDKSSLSQIILAIRGPQESLGAAIQDRLWRASQKR